MRSKESRGKIRVTIERRKDVTDTERRKDVTDTGSIAPMFRPEEKTNMAFLHIPRKKRTWLSSIYLLRRRMSFNDNCLLYRLTDKAGTPFLLESK